MLLAFCISALLLRPGPQCPNWDVHLLWSYTALVTLFSCYTQMPVHQPGSECCPSPLELNKALIHALKPGQGPQPTIQPTMVPPTHHPTNQPTNPPTLHPAHSQRRRLPKSDGNLSDYTLYIIYIHKYIFRNTIWEIHFEGKKYTLRNTFWEDMTWQKIHFYQSHSDEETKKYILRNTFWEEKNILRKYILKNTFWEI